MRTPRLFWITIAVLSIQGTAVCQDLPRTFGARALQLDDGSGSGKTLVFDLNGELVSSYRLHFPLAGPPSTLNYFAIDQFGNIQ